MKEHYENELFSVRKEHRFQKTWKRVAAALSCLVIAGTVAALTHPADTLTQEICGKEEHHHTEACYETVQRSVLSCSEETLGVHRHSAECYDAAGKLSCGYADFLAHRHTEACYGPEGEKLCSLRERKPHTHDESCYTTLTSIVDEGHTHSESCYGEDGSLICGQSERERVTKDERVLTCMEEEILLHTHTAGCFDENGTLVCPKTEIREHVHGESCYTPVSESVLVCGKEEHTHDESCYAPAEEEPSESEALEQLGDVSALADAGESTLTLDLGELEPMGELDPAVSLQSVGDTIPDTDISWTLDDDGTLTVTGSGAIPDYYGAWDPKAPWYDYQRSNSIRKVVVGEGITVIGQHAFSGYNSTALHEVVLPSTLTRINYAAFDQNKGLTHIDFPNGLKEIVQNAFSECDLSEVILPDSVERVGSDAFKNNPDLYHVYLGKNLTSLGGGAFSTYSIEKLSVDFASEHLTKAEYNVFYSNTKLDINIMSNVHTLHSGFEKWVSSANSIRFEAPTTLHIDAGSLKDYPGSSVVAGFAGDYYIDNGGAMYELHDDGTAALVYMEDGAESYTVPATVADHSVTTVKSKALADALKLKQLSFAAPEAITTLEDGAFADARKLGSINGKMTQQGAAGSFPNANKGSDLFINTNLNGGQESNVMDQENPKGSDLADQKDGLNEVRIWLNDPSAENRWRVGENGSGYYRYLTGETAKIIITGKPDDTNPKKYRLYVETTQSDAELAIKPGQTRTIEGVAFTCHTTDVPGVYYYEFHLTGDMTAGLVLEHFYPNAKSDGGGMRFYPAIVDESEADGTYIAPTGNNTIEVWWETERQEYVLTKQGEEKIYLISDKDGKGVLEKDVSWDLTFTRDETTETKTWGKDVVDEVIFTDTPTLPDGIAWRTDIIEALRNGRVSVVRRNQNWEFVYGGEPVFSFTQTGGNTNAMAYEAFAKLDESGKPVFGLKMLNVTNDTEFPTVEFKAVLDRESVTIDRTKFATQEQVDAKKLHNDVTADVSYTYSDPTRVRDDWDMIAEPMPPKLEAKKERVKTGTHLGDDVDYRITLWNDGFLPYTIEPKLNDESGARYVRDTLSAAHKITEANMEKMLRDETYGKALTITIDKAPFVSGSAALGTVTDINGNESAALQPWNSNVPVTTETVKIYWDGGNIVVDRGGSKTIVTGSLYDTLHAMGYQIVGAADTSVPYNASYTDDLATFTVQWDLSQLEGGTLPGGQEWTFDIPATIRNTFEYTLTANGAKSFPVGHGVHRWNNYSGYLDVGNTAYYTDGGTEDKPLSVRNQRYDYEVYLSKSVYRANNGGYGELRFNEVFFYRLCVDKMTDITYDTLPIVDHMSSGQYLLVPVEKNPGLASAGFATVVDDGTTYYKLDKAGTYHDVVVGGKNRYEKDHFVAETITVEADGKTTIQWYLTSVTNDQDIYYKVMAGDKETGIDNLVYASEREYANLYDRKRGKVVASAPGDFTYNKKAYDPASGELTSFSYVTQGQKVTYRLDVENKGDEALDMPITYLREVLPNPGGTFVWKAYPTDGSALDPKSGYVRIYTLPQEGITFPEVGVENNFRVQISAYYGGNYEVQWNDNIGTYRIDGGKTLYIYVELTYPSDESVWSAFSRYSANDGFHNNLFADGKKWEVEHTIVTPGKFKLQKGVWSTGAILDNQRVDFGDRDTYYNSGPTGSYSWNMAQRTYVLYYISVLNEGDSRLYLNDLVDTLPQGFKAIRLVATPADMNARAANVNTIPAKQTLWTQGVGEGLAKSMTLKMTTEMVDGKQVVRIVPTGGESRETRIPAPYGHTYFLRPGELLEFGLLCEVGQVDETLPVATNTVEMEFLDYANTGFVVSDGEYEALPNKDCEGQNDGGTEIKGKQTVASKVDLKRGEIIPGIAKRIESYTPANQDSKVAYQGSMPSNATAHWRVDMSNSGGNPICDYTLRDRLQAPYSFTGGIGFEIYDKRDVKAVWTTKDIPVPSAVSAEPQEVQFQVQVRTGQGSQNTANVKATVQLLQEEGEWVLELHFTDPATVLPAMGRMSVSLSSVNVSGDEKAGVYANSATLMPHDQPFYKTNAGIVGYDEDGNRVSVTASDVITATTGIVTAAKKYIEETGAPDNATDSTKTVNYIDLEYGKKNVKYTLEVEAPRDYPMSKLIVIDNLPEVGDTNTFNPNVQRGSAFKVSLAANPDFHVWTLDEQGNRKDITDYAVAFTTKTVYTEEDWKGNSSWNGNSAAARSLRVVIGNGTQEVVPKNGKAYVSFEAVIDGYAEPGTIAWNSFGYHYISPTKAGDIELEAMPRVVGLRIPDIPQIVKQLTDRQGRAFPTAKDETFTILITDGKPLSALSAGDRAYRVDLTVPAGKSSSEPLTLIEADRYVMGEDGKLSLEAAKIIPKWVKDHSYVVTEIEKPAEASFTPVAVTKTTVGDFRLGSVLNGSFTYNPDKPTDIRVTNVSTDWFFTLTKQLVNADGTPYTAQQDETYTFLLHKGEATESYENMDLYFLTLTVPKGQSEAGVRVSKSETAAVSTAYRYQGGKLSATNTAFSPTVDDSYTLREVKVEKSGSNITSFTVADSSTDLGGAFFRTSSSGENALTVTLSNNPALSVTNAKPETKWLISLLKQDGSTKLPLSGASFALYAEQAAEADGSAEKLQYEGKTWYRCAEGTTAADGKLSFSDLQGERYLLVETKAPEGYMLDPTPRLCERTKVDGSRTFSLSVDNHAGTVLPKTGGSGTFLYRLSGLALLAGAALCYKNNLRKRKGASS